MEKKTEKVAKNHRKTALLSFNYYICTMYENLGGHGLPLPPAADAHGN